MGRILNASRPAERSAARAMSKLLVNRAKRVLGIDGAEYSEGREPVDIERLISPLRYDVVVRRGFFEFLNAEHRLYHDDRERFLRLAKEQPYYVWFEKVSCARFRPHQLRSAATLAAAFADKVDRAAALYDSFQANGFLPGHRIMLRSGREIARSDSGKPASQTLFVGDGCHRLSLLLLSGIARLEPDWYSVKTVRRYVPLDNTSILLPHLRLAEADYARFLSPAFDAEFDAIDDLVRDVAERLPERSAELREILALDRPHLVAAAGQGGAGRIVSRAEG